MLGKLVEHLAGVAGLQLHPTPGNEVPAPGQFVHLATREPGAPQGVARLYLSSGAEVESVYRALHMQSVQVGPTLVTVEVTNDLRQAAASQAQLAGGRAL